MVAFHPELMSAETGGINQELMFGRPQIPPDHPLLEEARKRKGKKKGYLTYDEAMTLAMEGQRGKPSDPERPFANDLHAMIAEELGLTDYKRLNFFSAVGTPLDHLHGVDGFFAYNSPHGPIIVTLDVTLDLERKEGNQKADFVIGPFPNAKGPTRRDYLAQLHTLAHEIAEDIKRQEEEKAREEKRKD